MVHDSLREFVTRDFLYDRFLEPVTGAGCGLQSSTSPSNEEHTQFLQINNFLMGSEGGNGNLECAHIGAGGRKSGLAICYKSHFRFRRFYRFSRDCFFFLLVYQAENWSQMRACHVNIKQANNAQAEKFPAVILLENEIRSTKHVIS